MKKLLCFVLIPIFLTGCDTLQQVANQVLSEPTLAEVSGGLKEALQKGVNKGVSDLSVRDGYYKSVYKILLPPEGQRVAEKLRVVPGFEKFEQDLIERINRGAEEAAKEAGPIFLASIRQMTFQDASKILMGADNAATQYLNRTTYQSLYDKFNPKMVSALNKVGVNDLWSKATTAYNKLPFVTKVNTDLDDYITRRGLDGLFGKIEVEEKNIRNNVSARSTDLLRKVFAKQD